MADIDNVIRYLEQEAEAQEDYAHRAGDMDAYTNAARARARAVRLEHMAETVVRLAAEVARLRAAVQLAAIFARDVAHGPCAGADNVQAWSVTMKEARKMREILDAALGGQEAA